MNFYTYTWYRPDFTPYYIGKGHGDRAFTSYSHCSRPPKKANRLIDRSRILVQYWASEEEAFEAEKWWIKFWGRKDNGTGILRNLTDGGDGGSGHIHTEEHKAKIAASHIGMKASSDTRKAMSESAKQRAERDGTEHHRRVGVLGGIAARGKSGRKQKTGRN